MGNYEDKIYSLNETVPGQTQAVSQAVQRTLENNGGVGIMNRDRFSQFHGAGEAQILTADGTVNNVRLYKEDATDEAGR